MNERDKVVLDFFLSVGKWVAILIVPYILVAVVIQGLLLRWMKDSDNAKTLGALWPALPLVGLFHAFIYSVSYSWDKWFARLRDGVKNYKPKEKQVEADKDGGLPKATIWHSSSED